MKFLALTLVLLVGAALTEGRAIRDLKSDLITKGNTLIKDADAAVQKLTGAQKAQEAAIVKTEEARIKTLIAELETTTAEAALKRIEGELSRAEQKLQFEIQKINAPKGPVTGPVTRDLKSDLIAKGKKLIEDADAAFKKLNAAQKAAEAAVVKAEETAVKKLTADLEAATEEAALKKIEAELNAAEKKLAAEVAKLEKEVPKTPVTRDLKSDLIAKGQALIKEADAAVAKLTGLQKAAEAAIVRAEEQAIRRLITELEATTEEPALRRVESELQRAEARLQAEVAKISGTPTNPTNPGNPTGPGALNKEALITKGNNLIKQADEAVAKLTGNQKAIEGAIVKAEEAAIKALITELEAATEQAVVSRIEAELNRAEQRLQQEIARISRGGPVIQPVQPVPL